MNRCVRCVVPAHGVRTLLDGEGVCNHCRFWERAGPGLRNFERLGRRFEEKLARIRGLGDYDVMVGLSGGKDGAYLAYVLSRQFKLRVLTMTSDHGYMPNELARANIRRVVETLGLPHVEIRVPDRAVKKVVLAALNDLGLLVPCWICTHFLGWATCTKAAIENRVPMVVYGFDRGQLFWNSTADRLLEDLCVNLEPWNPQEALDRQTARLAEVDACFVRYGMTPEERRSLLPEHPTLRGTRLVPEHVNYYEFFPYDAAEISKTNREHAGWVPPESSEIRSHFDCDLKKSTSYTFASLGVGSPLEFELSVDIREGLVSRDAALRIITETQRQDLDCENPYSAYQDYCGISAKSHERKIRLLSPIAPTLCGCLTRLDHLLPSRRRRVAHLQARLLRLLE
ncbi:MAG: hypothetical protein MUF54_03820 [Polyangiaceae bacterium]|jgi:hypothetical protein|nr:hypothetical protein [Polyangiaceae bacterium]